MEAEADYGPFYKWGHVALCGGCGQCDNEHELLLCDAEGCNAGYHMRCLQPPLDSLPADMWCCRKCVSGGVAKEEAEAGGSAGWRRDPVVI